MERMKRAVSLLLCVFMVFGLLPMTAFAADNTAAGQLVSLEKVTSLSSGDEIIIGDNNGHYLVRNGTSITSTSDPAQATKWTVGTTTNYGTTYYTLSNGGYFLRSRSGNNNYTLNISNSTNNAQYLRWSYNASTGFNYNNYYLRYSSGNWGNAQGVTSGYGVAYKYTNSVTTVTFTVTPGSPSIAPNESVTLNGTAIVRNSNMGTEYTYGLSDCVVTWDCDDDNVSFVVNEDKTVTVTGLSVGTATLTATLSAVSGTALEEPITASIPVKVTNRTVTSAVLTGNTPVTTKLNQEPDFSKIKLTVTYDSGELVDITTANGLVIEGYDITKAGFSYATISYAGVEYGTVRVTVGDDSFAGLENATDYPEYPEDGAVRIKKNATEKNFENTGVVEVELDVAGVSVKGAVDVILVTDLSNSMAWAAGGRNDASSYKDTKMYDLAESVTSFADIFLAAEADGSATRNTMSLVTFGGYDADYTNKVYTNYADPTQTLILGTKDASQVKTTINNIRVLADDALNLGTSTTGYYLSFDGGKTYGENYGNTNYDHAFMQTADAIAELKEAYEDENKENYEDSGRQIYVIFMTDGAPSNYDGVYYNYQTNGDRADVNCTWINENGQVVTYTMGNNRAQYQAGPWFQYIAGGTYNANTQTIPGNPLYWADQVYNTTGVADIINVGFDLDNGGFSSMTFTEADGRPLAKVLEKLVTGQTLDVYSADDQAGMKEIYSKLATDLRYAGTSAEVTDIVDSEFTLQMGAISGAGSAHQANLSDYNITPHITVTEYTLWTKDETDDLTLIGGRKEGDEYVKVIETVTFNHDGTEAYSTVNGVTSGNIMTDEEGTVTINAQNFTYTRTPEGVETFDWKIGNITDKEIALSFTAYLRGSLEGTEPNGLKYTNEEATLEYIDIDGKHATKIFPIPAVAWGGASTAYEFYLVNEDGKPCDRNGNVVPFENRIIITGPYYEELYLNQEDENEAKEIIAAYVLPAGYTLYDENAKYSVVTASGTIEGSLTISEPTDGKEQTTILVSAVTPSYIQSRVAFGVMYNDLPDDAGFIIDPDAIVIDYGKSIDIDVDSNNTHIPDDVDATLVGFSRFYENVDVEQWFSSTSSIPEYEGTYGTFSINANGTVHYEPHSLINSVGKIFCHYRINEGNDVYYMVSELDVIPATIMYYETDFAEGVFTMSTTDGDWTTLSFADDPEITDETDKTQDDGTIGRTPIHQTYGYDSTYNDDAMLSDGDSLFVHGQGYETVRNEEDTENVSYIYTAKTYATFQFTGTGFDLISRTGADQGMIKVQVATDAPMSNIVKTVSVLNKSESTLELYQIPVVSINNLPHSTYYVKVEVDAEYTNDTGIPALDSLNRGNEFYFDAIRIYDPAMGNAIAENAYNADGEAQNDIVEVRQQLISAGTFDQLTGSTDGMVFVDSTYTDGVADETTGDVNVTDYTTIGPNNEVYLDNGQAVAFKVNANSIPASFDIGAKSITGQTAHLSVTITSDADMSDSWTVERDIASSTVQFIDLLSVAGADASKIFDGAYVVITNTGAGVLSITDLKTAFSVEPAAVAELDDPFAVSYTVDAATFSVARMVLTAPEAPEVPEEPEVPETTVPEEPEVPETTVPETTVPETTVPEETEPEVDTSAYDILDVSLKVNGNKKNQKFTFTVVTKQAVEDIKIALDSVELETSKISYKDNKKDGTRTWTIVLRSGDYDQNDSFVVTGIGENGVCGESVTVNNNKSR